MGIGRVPIKAARDMSDPADKERFAPDAVRPLTLSAQRALAEAAARRTEIDARTTDAPKEKGGRGGLDPVRYGDWEIKGLTADF